MKCPVCEGDNREGAHFCRHCGGELVQPLASEQPVKAQPKEEVAGAPAASSADATDATSSTGTPDTPSAEGVEPLGESEGEVELAAGEDSAVLQAEADSGTPEVSDSVHLEGEGIPKVGPEVAGIEEGVPEAGTEAAIVESEAGEVPDEAEEEETEAGALGDTAEPIGDGEVSPLPEWLEDQDTGVAPESDVDLAGFWRERTEAPAPLAKGTVLDDRYMISDVLDAQETTILYYARDLWRCWQCGFEGNGPTEAFCAQCGASLDRKPSVRLLEIDDAEAEAPDGGKVAARLAHDHRNFLVLAEPEPEHLALPERKSIRFLVGQRSDAGQVRELDEDSLLSLTLAPTYGSRTGPALGLFAVADGMGGHEGGEVASKLALQVLADRVIGTVLQPELEGEFRLDEDIVVRLRQAVMAANDEVYLARQKRGNDMGTTLTAVLIRDSRLFLAHVGDCRAYRWNADGLEQLTVDHSVVASMVATGQAAPEEIYTHPHRSVIYRSVGDQPTVQVDTDVLRLQAGDRIILCCDGLWEMVRSEGIEDVMLEESEPQAACDLLVSRANLAGGDDNISVIVIQVEAV